MMYSMLHQLDKIEKPVANKTLWLNDETTNNRISIKTFYGNYLKTEYIRNLKNNRIPMGCLNKSKQINRTITISASNKLRQKLNKELNYSLQADMQITNPMISINKGAITFDTSPVIDYDNSPGLARERVNFFAQTSKPKLEWNAGYMKPARLHVKSMKGTCLLKSKENIHVRSAYDLEIISTKIPDEKVKSFNFRPLKPKPVIRTRNNCAHTAERVENKSPVRSSKVILPSIIKEASSNQKINIAIGTDDISPKVQSVFDKVNPIQVSLEKDPNQIYIPKKKRKRVIRPLITPN